MQRLGRVRQHAIYRGPSGNTILQRDGFSMFAALFFPVWSATRGLYRTAIAALVGPWVLHLLLLQVFELEVLSMLFSLVAVATIVAAGLFANRWHRFVLQRAGWQMIAFLPEDPL